jgi:Fe-S-cluster containining protein
MKIKVESETPKFKCNACGSCCSHIRGFVPQQDRDFLKEHVFGKMPVVQLVPVEQMTFPLWDWEAKRFKEWGEEVKIDPRVNPLRVIFDLNTNKTIVLTYFMDSETDACPFLNDKKCSIYHTKRAYVCRLFPFNRGPFIEHGMALKDGMFGDCGAMEKILPQVPDDMKKMVSFLKNAFPDESFVNAVQNDLVIEWSNKIIIDLVKNKVIRPAMNYPYDFLIKRISNSEHIDFTDFLIQADYMTLEEKDNLIKRFDSNSEALQKITEFS